MYISSILFGLVILAIVWLWLKIRDTEERSRYYNTAVYLNLTPKNTIDSLPIIKEVLKLHKGNTHLDLCPRFWFFHDKNLVFETTPDGKIHINTIPSHAHDYLYSVDLGETRDGKTIQFKIMFRRLTDIIPNRIVGVYVGYLKKWEKLPLKRHNDEIVVLFRVPEYLVSPVSFSYAHKTDVIEMQRLLTTKFGLELRRNQDGYDIVDDFGEKGFVSVDDRHYENEYFEFRIGTPSTI